MRPVLATTHVRRPSRSDSMMLPDPACVMTSAAPPMSAARLRSNWKHRCTHTLLGTTSPVPRCTITLSSSTPSSLLCARSHAPNSSVSICDTRASNLVVPTVTNTYGASVILSVLLCVFGNQPITHPTNQQTNT